MFNYNISDKRLNKKSMISYVYILNNNIFKSFSDNTNNLKVDPLNWVSNDNFLKKYSNYK